MTPRWRRRGATVLGLLAVAAGTTGVALLRGLPDEVRAVPATAATPGATPPPADRAGTATAVTRPRGPGQPDPVRDDPVRGDSGRDDPAQPPGTVRLPEGGTARLVRTELTPDGTLPIPDRLGEASWWGAELGAERGVTVLSGHVNRAGRTGPFAELWRHRPGQRITVLDTEGGRWVYRVTDTVTLHKDALPAHAERLFSQDGPHRLVLVTCGGDYVGGPDGYSDNRIVTAELISAP